MPMFSVLAMLHHRLLMLAFFHDALSNLRSAKVVLRFIAVAMMTWLAVPYKISARCFRVACAIAAVCGMAKLSFSAICAVVTPSVS